MSGYYEIRRVFRLIHLKWIKGPLSRKKHNCLPKLLTLLLRRSLLDTGAVLSVITIETWEQMGFNKDDLIDSRIQLSAANKGALRVLGRTPIIALNLVERNLWMSFLEMENLD